MEEESLKIYRNDQSVVIRSDSLMKRIKKEELAGDVDDETLDML